MIPDGISRDFHHMPLHSIFYFIQTKLFEGGWLVFFFLFRDPSRWPKWHLRPDQVTILPLSFRPTPSATCPETSSAAKRPDRARVFLRHQERVVRALSSLVIILWAERPLKVPSNLLTVRLVKLRTKSWHAPRGAQPAADRRGFWDTISIHFGLTPLACEPVQDIQLALDWESEKRGYYVWPLMSSSAQTTYLHWEERNLDSPEKNASIFISSFQT